MHNKDGREEREGWMGKERDGSIKERKRKGRRGKTNGKVLQRKKSRKREKRMGERNVVEKKGMGRGVRQSSGRKGVGRKDGVDKVWSGCRGKGGG